MEQLIEKGKYNELAQYCERAELEAPQCIPSAEVYGALLGVYLIQDELDHAKLLWQRIPKSVKQEHKEVGELWEIGKCLWKKEFAAVYELTSNPKWPPHLMPLVASLVERLRQRVTVLVGKSYSTIRLGELCSLLGQNEQQVRQLATEKMWEFDSVTKVVKPKPVSAPESTNLLEHQEKLQKLTDIISFLEN